MKAFALALTLGVPPAGFAAVPAMAAETTARLTLDTPVETLLADPAGKAVVLANMPGFDTHPMFDMIKGMSLKQIQPYSEGKITDELLAKIGKELAEIK